MVFLRKRQINIFLCLLAAVVAGCGGGDSATEKSDSPYVEISGKRFDVELALTRAEQAKGLSGRTSLGADKGMLFIFSRPRDLSFYMKDCHFPIDAAFIELDDADGTMGTILNFVTMPVEADPANPVARYRPLRPVRAVLELNGGTLDSLGIEAPCVIKFYNCPMSSSVAGN